MSMTGHPDGPPARLGVGAIDLGTGMWAAVGIQAALRNRSESGVGALVEVSLYETAAWWLSYHLEGYLATGESPQRQGNGTPFVAPYEVFATADVDLMVAAGNNRLFISLCRVLGLPDLPADPAYATNADRVANRVGLHELLEERFRKRTAAEWEALLGSRNNPVQPVSGPWPTSSNDPQLEALGHAGRDAPSRHPGPPRRRHSGHAGRRASHPPAVRRHDSENRPRRYWRSLECHQKRSTALFRDRVVSC